ncbi:MAG: class I SAM-dependent methyltransferase [Ferruginibacter sp.]
MTIKESYNEWAGQYDNNLNRTRDLEARALRECLHEIPPGHWLEAGCGTGKNTGWLAQKAEILTAADFSEGMLQVAKEKNVSENVEFITMDLCAPWPFKAGYFFDAIIFSLVLEHIEDLPVLMKKAAAVLQHKGLIYIAELHPYKQYSGSKARFMVGDTLHELTCYTHHVSDYLSAASSAGLSLHAIKEYFDEEPEGRGKGLLPRLLVMIFQKK